MTIEISAQSLITAGAVISALTVIVGILVKLLRFVDRQKAQDLEIKADRSEREAELEAIRRTHSEDMRAVREEQTLIVYGVLACLKGLREQGCNGPVTRAIEKLEKHLNIEAHK